MHLSKRCHGGRARKYLKSLTLLMSDREFNVISLLNESLPARLSASFERWLAIFHKRAIRSSYELVFLKGSVAYSMCCVS